VLLTFLGPASWSACGLTGENSEFALSPGPAIGAVSRINGIALADLDSDGALDLVVGGGSELLVLLGAGDGRFETSSDGPIPVGEGASGPAVGDVNGDRMPDVVVSRHDSYEVLVLLSDGEGRLTPAATSPVIVFEGGTPHSHEIELADVNTDRHLDLLMAQSENDQVLVLLGDGAAGFTAAPGSPFGAGEHPYTITAADLDGDGDIDLATPNGESGDLSVLLGDGTGGFRALAEPRVALGARPLATEAGDLDADGHVDLVVSGDDSAKLRLLHGNGRGGFEPSDIEFHANGAIFGQTIVDVDADGNLDVIATGGGAVHVWLHTKSSAYRRSSVETPGVDSQVVAVGDIDGNGTLDVVAGGWDEAAVVVLLATKRTR
jgi:hypothetical protein